MELLSTYILFYIKAGGLIDDIIENHIMTVLGYGVEYFILKSAVITRRMLVFS